MNLSGKDWRKKLQRMLKGRPVIRTKAEAFIFLQSIVKPTAPRRDMERAIRFAYEFVPDFGDAFKDCVCIGGIWDDLVEDYQGSNPKWRKDPHANRVVAAA